MFQAMSSRKAKQKAVEALRKIAAEDEARTAKFKAEEREMRRNLKRMLEGKLWPSEGVLGKRPFDEKFEEVQVKWAGFHW